MDEYSTALLDQDINALMHHGVKNMHWYQHMKDKVQQPLERYAKGAQTKGIDITKMRKLAFRAKRRAKRAAENGNMERAAKLEAVARKRWRAQKMEKMAKDYNDATRVRRALAGAAASAVGFGLKTAENVYRTGRRIKQFITNPTSRKLYLSNFKGKLKRKARKFSEMISSAFKGVFGKKSTTTATTPAPKGSKGPYSNQDHTSTKSTTKTTTKPATSAKDTATRVATQLGSTSASNAVNLFNKATSQNRGSNKKKKNKTPKYASIV